jgi:hypothetical protein
MSDKIDRLRRRLVRAENELAREILRDVLTALDSHTDPREQVRAAYQAVRAKRAEWLGGHSTFRRGL